MSLFKLLNIKEYNMRKIINILLLIIILSSFVIWNITWTDGLWLVWIHLLMYIIMWNFIYTSSVSRINKKHGIINEFILFIFTILIMSSFIASQKNLLCSIECFWINTILINNVLLAIFWLLFTLNFFRSSTKKQNIHGWIISIILFIVFTISPIIHWYKHTYTLVVYENSSTYYKDSENVYCRLGWIDPKMKADLKSFEWLDDIYAKDKNTVYYLCSPLDNADANTFKVLKKNKKELISIKYKSSFWMNINFSTKNPYWIDNEHVFYLWKIIDWANPYTFTVLKDWYAKDDKNTYYKGIKK